MAHGVSLHAMDDKGLTPLSYAAEEGHTSVVQLLLWRGADVKATTQCGWTALHGASEAGQDEAAALLIAAGAALDSVNARGDTPLHRASALGRLAAVCVLLDAGAGLEVKDGHGLTPLLIACKAGQDEVVGELLQRGAQPDVRCSAGGTVLTYACRSGCRPLVQRLLQRREVQALVDVGGDDIAPPLCQACQQDDFNLVKLLVAAGADLSVRWKGMTPLHLMLRQLSDCIDPYMQVAELLAAGADADALCEAGAVDRRDGSLEGASALQMAMRDGVNWTVPLLATPASLRHTLLGQTQKSAQVEGNAGEGGEEDEQQQQQQHSTEQPTPGDVVQSMAKGLRGILLYASALTEQALPGYCAVKEVFGVSQSEGLLREVLDDHWNASPRLAQGLLQAAHKKWLGDMPLMQHKWGVTDRLQRLVTQQQQQQQEEDEQREQQAYGCVTQPAGAAAGESQPQDGMEFSLIHIVSNVYKECPPVASQRLWAQAVAAADARQWQAFVQHLEQLMGLDSTWAIIPLYDFALRRGVMRSGVAALSDALLMAWWQARRQPQLAAKVAEEMREAILAAVHAWEQRRIGVCGRSRG
jgi:ankyrin repeat protein